MNFLLSIMRRYPALYQRLRSPYRKVRRFSNRVKVRESGRDNLVSLADAWAVRRTEIVIEGDGNSIQSGMDASLDGGRITIHGQGNHVLLGQGFRASGLIITITGDRNRITVGDACTLLSTTIVCENDGNGITIGATTEIHGGTELAAIEGTHITIGENCGISGGIHFVTGDSHSITDLEGRRINPSEDIVIGDHVWVGTQATVMKGASVASNSIIGACSLVTRRFETPHSIIAGNPAKLIRTGIDWRHERLPCA